MMRKLKEAKKVDRGLNVHKYQKELKVKMRNFKLLTQLLLSKGANVDQKDIFGATPLMYASQGGVCQMMEILIRDGNADLERKDKYNNTALHYAIAYNQIAAANFLEDNGVDALALNDIDETPTDVAGIRKSYLTQTGMIMEKIETTGIAITQQRTTIIAALQIITTHRRHLRTIDQAEVGLDILGINQN